MSKERSALIRLASTMPKGSAERKAVLAGLQKKASQPGGPPPGWRPTGMTGPGGAAIEDHVDSLKALFQDLKEYSSQYSSSSIGPGDIKDDAKGISKLMKDLQPEVKALMAKLKPLAKEIDKFEKNHGNIEDHI